MVSDGRNGKSTTVGVRKQKCHREGSYRVRLRVRSWNLLGPRELTGLGNWRRDSDRRLEEGVHSDTIVLSRHYPLIPNG